MEEVEKGGKEEMKFQTGDIVRINDTGFPGLYEFVEYVGVQKIYDGFDFNCIVTKDECDTEMYEHSKRLTLVCGVENRLDLGEGE